MAKKNSPGCGCCGCPIHSDKFDRADSTTIGSGYTETAGAWEIANNYLKTASSNATLRYTMTGQELESYEIRVKVRAQASGDVARISLPMGTSHFLQIKFNSSSGAGELAFISSATTIRARVFIDAFVDTWYSLKVTVQKNGTIFNAVAYLDGVPVLAAFSGGSIRIALGSHHELLTGTVGGASYIEWNDYEILELDDDSTNPDNCPNKDNPCPGCFPEPRVPTYHKVTTAGAVNDSCLDCSQFNADWYVPVSPNSSARNCQGIYTTTQTCSSYSVSISSDHYAIGANSSSLPVICLLSTTGIGSGCQLNAQFRLTSDEKMDCAISHSIPLVSSGTVSDCCDMSAATCDWEIVY